MKKKIISLLLVILATANIANAQTTEVKISLNEQFFEALLEAVFNNLNEPSVPISINNTEQNKSLQETTALKSVDSPVLMQNVSYINDGQNPKFSVNESSMACSETIRLQRQVEGVRTAVRFQQGKIFAPIAFKGNYNPPLIGCIEFQGWAETNIELYFDKQKNALVGKATVLNVNLSGTGGVGSSLLTRFVQNSIDNKVNPIEIIKLDKLSFVTPIQNSGNLRVKAQGITHKINDRSLDIYIKYEFLKG